MKLLIRGYDIYPNSLFVTRVSGITLFTENTIKDIKYLINRDKTENIDFYFARSVKVDYQRESRILDDIHIYDIDTTDTFSIYGKYSLDVKAKFAVDKISVKDGNHPLLKPRIDQFSEIYEKIHPDVIWAVNGMPICELIHSKLSGKIPLDTPVVASISDIFEDVKELIIHHENLLDIITTPSKHVFDQFKSYIPSHKLKLIDHGIDILKIKNGVTQVDIDNTINKSYLDIINNPSNIILIIPARRVPHKGHIYAIRAIKDVIKKYPNLYMFITGDEGNNVEYHAELVREIKKNQVSTNVILTEPLTSQQVWWLISKAHISLIPSYFEEGFCYANMEAMLLNTIVVTSNIGAPLLYIQNSKNGFFVEVKSEDSIKKVLLQIISLSRIERERIMENALKTAIKYHSIEKSKEFLELFFKINKTHK